MNFKLSTLLAASLITCTSGIALAAESAVTLSGSAALTSDYRYRGLTQTQSDAALQAGFNFAHTSGVYAGVWGSNVNFGTDDPHLELDPYLGYSTELSAFASKPVLDVGVWYYNYPSASELNWAEFYARLTFGSLITADDSLMTNINYANDFLGDGAEGDQWYFNATYSIPFGAGFGGVASLGYTTTSDYEFDSKGSDDYLDWKVGVNYAIPMFDGLTAELAAVGTDIDTDDMSNVTKRGVETGAVFTLTKTF
ncbi:conserved hypothetical protein [Acinetobacter marinus]|uniref:Outer membrane protein n=1 Tax=Acinetobacter marinus TaxID=281375 RepID=A0A1G6HBP5_9GAMM|nr:TorF family putative porin [Acinetobacter marinus]SDB91702.1 conserved hypothetical protein [Acinetobacter marinus]